MSDRVMQLWFYRARGDWFDRFVRWWTRSPYSHVELAIADCGNDVWLCASSSPRDDGVRYKLLSFDAQTWDALPISADPEAALAWFEAHKGERYDWCGVLRCVWGPLVQAKQRWFCSEAICASLGIPDPWRITPATLAVLARIISTK